MSRNRNPWNVPGSVRVYLRQLEEERERWTIDDVQRGDGDEFTIMASEQWDDGYWEGDAWISCIVENWLTVVVKYNNRQTPVTVLRHDVVA